jgi:hypothetical protein
MLLDAEAGLHLHAPVRPLSAGALRRTVAHITRRPQELYWRFRLIRGLDPSKGAPRPLRALALDSARRLIAADPAWFAETGLPAMMLTGWTPAEARAVLTPFRSMPRAAASWVRAWFWFSCSTRCTDERLFLTEARGQLESIPVRSRPPDYAEFLGEVLLRHDVAAFEGRVTDLVEGLDDDSPSIAHRLLRWMSRFEATRRDGPYRVLAARFRALPVHLRSGRDRIVFDTLEGLRALRAGDLKTTRACLDEMIVLAPQAEFLANDDTMALVRELKTRKQLLPQVRRYVDATLTSDWRSWVRPELEEFQRAVTAASSRRADGARA